VDETREALKAKKKDLNALKAELDEKTAALNEIRAIEIEMRNKLEENQKVLAENQKRQRYWNEKLGKLSLQNISDLGDEIEAQELPTYTKDELTDMSKDTLKSEIAALEEKTQNVNVELGVLAEYRRRVEEHAARNADLQSAVAQRDSAKKRCDDLRRLRLEGFMEGFSTISLRLKEMYQMITMGGNAELELVDSLDPFSEGILFSVMPPKKSWKNISNLSGGEKTLSSLALVFALHHYKPTPLYVMDEIDAALDFRNVSTVLIFSKIHTNICIGFDCCKLYQRENEKRTVHRHLPAEQHV
jgi:structural maintenance of chromosome 4